MTVMADFLFKSQIKFYLPGEYFLRYTNFLLFLEKETLFCFLVLFYFIFAIDLYESHIFWILTPCQIYALKIFNPLCRLHFHFYNCTFKYL